METGVALAGTSWDTVVVGLSSAVLALSAATGATVWTMTTQDAVAVTPASSPNGAVVYAGCNDHNLYALDAATGSVST